MKVWANAYSQWTHLNVSLWGKQLDHSEHTATTACWTHPVSKHPMRWGWAHLFVSHHHELTTTKLQWSHGKLILWAHKCEIFVTSLWEHSTSPDCTGLLVVSSGYYWGLRWLFVVCVITGDVECSHKEVTKISHLWVQEYELAMTPLQLGRG